MDWNFNFCTKKKNRFDYCYNKCNKTCPTISNITYKFIINPLHHLIWAIQNKFMKCDKLPTKCSFLFCKKYCTLIGGCGVYKNLK